MELINVSYGKVLNNLNYEFNNSRIYGLIGSKHSNITLLMELIRGLESATSGLIKNNSNAYMLFENSVNQIFNKTVREEILYGVRADAVDLKEILETLALDETVLDQDPLTLSNGEKRKVVFASMLASNPDIILIDNFFNTLDFENKKIMLDILKRLQFDLHKLIIIYDSNINELFEFAEDVVLIEDTILLSGDKFDVFHNQQILDDYGIELPDYVKFSNLVYKLKKIELPYRDRVSDIMKDVYDNV